MSNGFSIGVGVHQGSALSPLLFKVIMEEAAKMCRRGDPWELLYADDLVLTAESKEELMEMFNRWRNAIERCGMKINVQKTKLLISGMKLTNSILCTSCNMSCHKRCTGLSTFAGIQNYVYMICDGTHACRLPLMTR